MELLEQATPEQEARAARLESERLRHVNGNPLAPRAFASDQKLRQAASRPVDVRGYSRALTDSAATCVLTLSCYSVARASWVLETARS